MLNKISGSIVKRSISGTVGKPLDINSTLNNNNIISGTILNSGPTQTIEKDWSYYALKWDTPPVKVNELPSGDVYLYVLDNVERYRYVPTVYTPQGDVFYGDFISGVLFNPIVTRS